jgi:KDO2-lipid IV(A) lauroyltransferase
MNRRSIEDLIFYWTVLGFKSLLSILPYSWAVPIGAGVIYGLSFIYPRRFGVAYTNIKTAFPHFTPGRIKHLVRKSVFNLSLSLMEVLLIDKLNKEKLMSLVTVKGERYVKQEKGRGIIFLTAHYDNWELIALFGALYGYPSYVIARQQKYPRLNSLLNRHRKKFGNIVVEKGFSIKKAIQALKRGERIGILADQNAGKNGLQIKLFGKAASTNPGFIHLARRASAVVLPIFIRRISLLRHELVIHPPLDISRPEKEVLTDYHQILESYINRNPEQWLWFHKRWKHSIDKRILVLSDSKPGHFRQSRAVAKKLKHALKEKFKLTWPEDEPQIIIKEVEVSQQNPVVRFFSYLWGLFSSPRCQGCLRCFHFFLPPKVYQQLVFDRYDYIISAGSSLQAVNAIINYENKARNICILRPGFGYRDKFDKIFVPEHDKFTGRNIVCFRGAIVDKEEIILKGRDFLSRLNLKSSSQAIKISLLIGGETKSTRFKISVLKEFLNQLEQIAPDLNVQLFITTSRRTPPEVENYLEQFKNEHVKLLIIANKENPPGGVEGILILADVIFVTSDSISMIVEAIAMDKGVGIVMTNKPDKKLKRFLQLISQIPNVRLISQGEIKELGGIIKELQEASTDMKEKEDSIIQGIEALL